MWRYVLRRTSWLDITGYGRWTITDSGRAVLKGRDRFSLRKDTLAVSGRTPQRPKAALGELSQGDQILFEALKQRRSALAKAQGVPAYVIFADRALLDMVRRRPKTAAEMSEVHGVGEAKLAQFGTVFLD